MRIVYIAFDGKEFDKEEVCREYEENLRDTFVMWDRKGNETDDPDHAMFLLLKTEGAGAAFIKWQTKSMQLSLIFRSSL